MFLFCPLQCIVLNRIYNHFHAFIFGATNKLSFQTHIVRKTGAKK